MMLKWKISVQYPNLLMNYFFLALFFFFLSISAIANAQAEVSCYDTALYNCIVYGQGEDYLYWPYAHCRVSCGIGDYTDYTYPQYNTHSDSCSGTIFPDICTIVIGIGYMKKINETTSTVNESGGGPSGWTYTATIYNYEYRGIECIEGQTRPCYDGPAGSAGIGECRSGTQACINGYWDTTCSGEVLPQPEICDGLDNNCNDQVDEGFECKTGNTRPCYDGSAGTQGVGICRGGTQTCNNCQWDTTCNGEVLPQSEICDGLDNNCNGQVDEGFPCRMDDTRPCYDGPAGTQGVGICRGGTQACNNCQWDSTCHSQVLPKTTEKCDGKDNNCNGKVNEGCDTCEDQSGQSTAGDDSE